MDTEKAEPGARQENIVRDWICNRCGKVYGGKASLKRHKKKCKATKDSSEKVVSNSGKCPFCDKKCESVSAHKASCSDLQKEIDAMEKSTPCKGAYFINRARNPELKVRDSILVELCTRLTKKEKLQFVQMPRNVNMVASCFANNYSHEFYVELLRDLNGKDLMFEFSSRPGFPSVNLFHLAISRYPSVPLETIEMMTDMVPPELRGKDCASAIQPHIATGTAELFRVLTKGIIGGKHVPHNFYFLMTIDALRTNSVDRENVMMLFWDKMSNKEKTIHMDLFGDGLGHTVLTSILNSNHQFDKEFMEKLIEGLPKQFAYTYDYRSRRHIPRRKVPHHLVPEVKNLLSEWLGIEKPKYILYPYSLYLPALRSPMDAWEGMKHLIQFNGDHWFNTGGYNGFMTVSPLDYEFFCRMMTPQICRNPNTMFVGDTDVTETMFHEFMLLTNQSQSLPRKRLVQLIDGWFESDKTYSYHPSPTKLKFVFDACCGLKTDTIVKNLSLSHGSDFSRWSDGQIDDISAGDEFYKECFRTKTFPNEFFSKARRIKTLMEASEKKKDANDLIGTVDLWWRSLLSNKIKTSEYLRKYSIADFAMIAHQLMENKKSAWKCCTVGLFVHEANKERFTLFYIRGKIHRFMRDAISASSDFQMALFMQPDLKNALYESGVSFELMSNPMAAAIYFNRVLVLNDDPSVENDESDAPVVEKARNRLKYLVEGAENKHALMKKCYKHLYDGTPATTCMDQRFY